MKGFLQKLAYTIQTIIYFGGLGLFHYSRQVKETGAVNEATKSAIGFIGFGAPAILVLLSLIIFSKKFKLHGELADKVHDFIVERRAEGAEE